MATDGRQGHEELGDSYDEGAGDYLAELELILAGEIGEWEWWSLGPFAGAVPGFVRRVRRILDVSQRGLAAILEVSQSAVARWETGRTSPRVSVVLRLLELARLRVEVRDEDGEVVGPMRDDGARDRGGRRFPAHVDLHASAWFLPRRVPTGIFQIQQERRSRAARDPRITFRTSRWRKHGLRLAFGTPDDHPARHQLVAEVVALDEAWEARRPPRCPGPCRACGTSRETSPIERWGQD